MKAVQVKNKAFRLVEMDPPTIKANEVRLKVLYTSLNAGDYRLVQMNVGLPKSGILGNAIVGIVETLGSDVSHVKLGDCVVVDTSNAAFGGLAEYAVAKAAECVLIPAKVSLIDAAACPVASTTALQALTLFRQVQANDRVLIIGASGGVGTFMVQIAKIFKAHVTGVCSTRNVDMLTRLKADVIIDYQKTDVQSLNETYDFVIVVNGAYSLSLISRLLTPRGMYIMVGGPIKHFIKNLLLCPIYSLGQKEFKILSSKSNTQDLALILQMIQEAKLKPIIEGVYKLDQSIEVFKTFEKGHSQGKIVIQVAP